MAVEIREISTKRELKKFIQFANDLYADCPYYCPPLFFDEMNCFNPETNPALEVSEYQLWMASALRVQGQVQRRGRVRRLCTPPR